MGAFVPPDQVFRTLGQLNARFAEGDPIGEMVALQREFSLFSKAHELSASFSALGLIPIDEQPRQNWLKYLEHLKSLPSSEPPLTGHDLIRETLRRHLEGDGRPVFFQYHDEVQEPRVMLKESMRLVISAADYVVISVPARSAPQAKRAAVTSRKSARTAAGSKPAKSAKSAKPAKAAPARKTGKAGKASR